MNHDIEASARLPANPYKVRMVGNSVSPPPLLALARANLDHAGAQAAELLGYEQSTVSRWIRHGHLKATPHGQPRADGRTTMWSITPKALRQFLIDNPLAVELRRLPAAHQPWLIELLTGRGPSVTA